MTTVSTKQELISAIKRREKQIIATGEIAASIRRKVKVKKGAKVGGLVLAIGGTAVAITGVLKDAKVVFKPDGSVVEPHYKD